MLHLYFADAVDRYGTSLSDSSVGRSMKSLALDKVAEDLKVTRSNVASMYKMGSKYLTCMEAGGPGSLFSIDGAKSDMEKCNDEDFKMLFKYRKSAHPDLEERSRTLDFGVAHNLVCGLRAQGVDDADIAGGRTRLMRLICQYVDIRTFLRNGEIIPKEQHGNGECGDMGNIPSGRSSPSQSPQIQERTDVDGQKDIPFSPDSGNYRTNSHQLPLPVKDSMPVHQSCSNSPAITNCAKDGPRRLSMPLPFPMAGKSNRDARDIEVQSPYSIIEVERYDGIAENPSKRRRLHDDHSNHSIDRIAITSEVVSLPQELREESTGLDVQDFSTDINEWLQEFGNVDPSNGMDFVVGLLQTW
ncbi:hypothetical protein L13192_10162 [Pyrenophora tritici-repentis]|nr:hypothetical protein L13192_12626 [Pyrenophora tritici-repentis]KAI1665221.1 hypothetical protein L13192_10162 [Pyrenophora tritici-repentis]